MQVILHAGAHGTESERMLRTLVRNAPDLRDAGIAVPKPSRYRRTLSTAMNELTGAQPTANALSDFIGEAMGGDAAPVSRIILSSENFFTVPKRALADDVIYPRAGERMRNLQKLFRDCDITLCLGLRNPATWLPAVWAETPHDHFLDFLNGCDVHALRWYELIYRIRDMAPGVPLLVWCNEDTPLLWGSIARGILGLPEGTKIKGAFDVLSDVMTAEGMQRFRAYLRSHPDMSEPQKRRVMVAFLEQFAEADALEEEIDVPGWTAETIEALTEAYEDDVRQIADMEGVTLFVP